MSAARPPAKLPQDPDYWEGLAGKIRDDAAAPLAAYAAASGAAPVPWFGVLARRAPWWLAASVAAIVMLWLALPPRDVSPGPAWIEAELAPSGAAATLVSGPAPPAVDDLLGFFSPAGEQEVQR